MHEAPCSVRATYWQGLHIWQHLDVFCCLAWLSCLSFVPADHETLTCALNKNIFKDLDVSVELNESAMV